jgi:hypothetical protein
MQNQTDQIRVLANISGYDTLDSNCEQDHAQDKWKCLYGQYRIPYLRTKYLMFASSYDAYQLGQVVNVCILYIMYLHFMQDEVVSFVVL